MTKSEPQDIFQPLTEDMLSQISGGIESSPFAFETMKVKCPVNGCNFECRDFGEMNEHMKTVHHGK